MGKTKTGDGAKKEFPDLDQDEQDEIGAKSREDLREFIAKVAMDSVNVMKQRDEDQDLKEKKEAAAEAGKYYTEALKRNNQRTRLAMRCLGDKGGDTQPGIEEAAGDGE